MTDQPAADDDLRRPPQFGLRTLFVITTAVAMLFGTLRWVGVSPEASTMVLVILAVSAAMAVAVVLAIAGTRDDRG